MLDRDCVKKGMFVTNTQTISALGVTDADLENDVYTQSFSRLISQSPRQVLRVTNSEQARVILAEAFSNNIAVNFRGAGHSFGDHCISDGGVLVLNAIHRPVERLDDVHFSISAGSTWLATEVMLNAHGRSAPVLSNWLHVTVAGTLSVGGYGWASLRYGGQTDNVESISLIDGSCELRAITPNSGADWGVATCSAGRLGFVTDCIISTVPAAKNLHLACRSHATVQDLTTAMRRDSMKDDAPEMAWAQVKQDSFLQFAAERSDESIPKQLLAGADTQHSVFPWTDWLIQHSHREFAQDVAFAWSDYVLPADAFDEFTDFAWRLASESENAALWRPRMRILAMQGTTKERPAQLLSASRLNQSGMRFGVGVYLEPPLARPDIVTEATEVLTILLEACITKGGRPYFGSWHEMNEQLAMRAYGQDLIDTRQILSQFPNAALMNPGQHPLL